MGFPINFRSALELSYIFHNKGRFGAQFNHISNAHMFHKNPGANSLFIFYAIPFPPKEKRRISLMETLENGKRALDCACSLRCLCWPWDL